MKLTRIFGLLALVVPAWAMAANTGTTVDLQRCVNIDNDIARLQCFDNLAKSVKAIKVKATPAEVAAPAPKTRAEKEAEFGMEKHVQAQHEESLPEQISSKVTRLRKDPYGHAILSLENDQVWKQKSGRTLLVRKDDVVIIERGVLGAFYLHKKGSQRSVRVTRVN